MSTTAIEDMLIVIDAQTERLRRELRKSDGQIDRFERNTNRKLKKIDRSFKALGTSAARFATGFLTVAAVQAVVSGLGQAADQALNLGRTLDDTAQKLGLTIEGLQELRFAAQESGVTQQTLDMAIQRFTRRLGEAAQGAGELKPVLEQYNIAVRDAQGRTRSTTDVLRDLANVTRDAGSANEQLRIAFKAFDSEGAALVNVLRQGEEGIDRYAQQARDLGLVLDTQTIEKLAETKRELDRVNQQIKAADIQFNANVATLRLWGAEFELWVSKKIDAATDALSDFDRFLDETLRNLARSWGAPIGPAAVRDPDQNVTTVPKTKPGTKEIKKAQQVFGDWTPVVTEVDRTFEKFNERLRRTEEIGQSVAGGLGNAFDEFLEGGKVGFHEFADSALKDLARVLFRQAILQPLVGAISGNLVNTPFGGLPLSQRRAEGGPVAPGLAYLVGEKGPEMFVPRIPGMIVPNGAAGGSTVVNVINNTSGQVETRESRTANGGRQIDVVIDEITAQNIGRTGSGSNRAVQQLGGRPPLIGR